MTQDGTPRPDGPEQPTEQPSEQPSEQPTGQASGQVSGQVPGQPAERPSTVRALDSPESGELAALATTFDDLQYVLLCCELLVQAISGPATAPVRIEAQAAQVEAFWTGALIGYARCFREPGALSEQDVDSLELGEHAVEFHRTVLELRDHWVSPDVNPRATVSVGLAMDERDEQPLGVAITSPPTPGVDDTTVRTLGTLAYRLSGLVDGRMAQSQATVLEAARTMSSESLQALPVVQLDG